MLPICVKLHLKKSSAKRTEKRKPKKEKGEGNHMAEKNSPLKAIGTSTYTGGKYTPLQSSPSSSLVLGINAIAIKKMLKKRQKQGRWLGR
jgi:hypothetical protein